MTNEKWFVLEGDEELGPLGPNGLRKWLREGRIRRDTRLRRQDQTIALRADQVQALFPRATQRVRTRPRSAELRGQPKAAATGPFVTTLNDVLGSSIIWALCWILI